MEEVTLQHGLKEAQRGEQERDTRTVVQGTGGTLRRLEVRTPGDEMMLKVRPVMTVTCICGEGLHPFAIHELIYILTTNPEACLAPAPFRGKLQ